MYVIHTYKLSPSAEHVNEKIMRSRNGELERHKMYMCAHFGTNAVHVFFIRNENDLLLGQ